MTSNPNPKKTWLPKLILLAVASFIVFLITISVESGINNYSEKLPSNVFLGDAVVQYAALTEYGEINEEKNQFPYFFKFSKDGFVTVLDSLKITGRKDTIFRTLTFKKNRLHLELKSGEAVIDNRLSDLQFSFQIKNAFVTPFESGIIFAKDQNGVAELTQIVGQSKIHYFNKEGKELGDFILLKGKTITLTEAKPQVNDLTKISPLVEFAQKSDTLNEFLKQSSIFEVTFKGQNYLGKDLSWMQKILKALIVNKRKQNFVNIFDFKNKIAEAASETKVNSEILLDEALQIFTSRTTEDGRLLNLYSIELEKLIKDTLPVTPSNHLYDLKSWLIKNFVSLIKNPPQEKIFLSLLEDLDVSAQIDAVEEDEIIQSLKLLKPETTPDYFTIIDNILSRNLSLNTKEMFELRQNLFDNFKDKESIKKDFDAKTVIHLTRLEKALTDGSLDAATIKDAVTFLSIHINPEIQVQFSEFFNKANVEAIGF